MKPAIALLEFTSIAAGIVAGDAMVKRATLSVTRAGTAHPGKYLVLVAGEVGEVAEALEAGKAAGGSALLDVVFLPDVHPGVVETLTGGRQPGTAESLGIIETNTVAAAIEAADAGLKGTAVSLLELRLADGLGGKGYLLFGGTLSEVEAAVEIGSSRVPVGLIEARVIAQLHPEMGDNLWAESRFRKRIQER